MKREARVPTWLPPGLRAFRALVASRNLSAWAAIRIARRREAMRAALAERDAVDPPPVFDGSAAALNRLLDDIRFLNDRGYLPPVPRTSSRDADFGENFTRRDVAEAAARQLEDELVASMRSCARRGPARSAGSVLPTIHSADGEAGAKLDMVTLASLIPAQISQVGSANTVAPLAPEAMPGCETPRDAW